MAQPDSPTQNVLQQFRPFIWPAVWGVSVAVMSFVLSETMLFWWLRHAIVGVIIGSILYHPTPWNLRWFGWVLVGVIVAGLSFLLFEFLLPWWLPYLIILVGVSWVVYLGLRGKDQHDAGDEFMFTTAPPPQGDNVVEEEVVDGPAL